jgi:hypothetical protein
VHHPLWVKARAVLQQLLSMSDSQLEALQAAGVLTLPKA